MAAFAGAAWGVRFALAGAVVGTVFALALRATFRGRRLAEINPFRFALLGAAIGGVGVPLYLQAMNLLTDGHIIAWHLVTGQLTAPVTEPAPSKRQSAERVEPPSA